METAVGSLDGVSGLARSREVTGRMTFALSGARLGAGVRQAKEQSGDLTGFIGAETMANDLTGSDVLASGP